MTSVLIKTADINVGYLKVKVDLLKRWHPKVCKKKSPTCICGLVRQFCPLGHCLASLGRVPFGQISLWKDLCLNFRVITANILAVQ